MKSKAQEYVTAATKVPDFQEPGYFLYVSRKGDLMCQQFSTITSPETALKLRDWLTDTFDTPVVQIKSLPKFELDLEEETEFPPTKY